MPLLIHPVFKSLKQKVSIERCSSSYSSAIPDLAALAMAALNRTKIRVAMWGPLFWGVTVARKKIQA